MADDEIKTEWRRLIRLYQKSRLGRALARVEADELERKGVTEADIDRLFPESAQ